MVAFQVLGSATLKSLAGVVLIAVGAVGSHEPSAAFTRHSYRIVEASSCRTGREARGHDHDGRGDDRGHDHGGHGVGHRDGHGHDHGGHHDDGHGDDGDDGGPSTGSGMLQQVLSVRVPASTFIRLDKSGRIIGAATNTRCQPSKHDKVFLFRVGGAVEPTTTIHVEDFKWIGDFTVPGRFQPQDCRADHRRDKTAGS